MIPDVSHCELQTFRPLSVWKHQTVTGSTVRGEIHNHFFRSTELFTRFIWDFCTDLILWEGEIWIYHLLLKTPTFLLAQFFSELSNRYPGSDNSVPHIQHCFLWWTISYSKYLLLCACFWCISSFEYDTCITSIQHFLHMLILTEISTCYFSLLSLYSMFWKQRRSI